MGTFVPTELGETLMHRVCGPRSAWYDLSLASRDLKTRSSDRPDLEHTTAYADAKSAEDQCAALELELRGPDGSLIPTESIAIQDTEFLLALPDESEAELEFERDNSFDGNGLEESELAALADEMFGIDDECDDLENDFRAATDESWVEPSFPRYQILVSLVNEWSVP